MADTTDPDELVTLTDAAALTGRSVSVLRRAIYSGVLRKHERPAPHGGSPLVVVSRAELVAAFPRAPTSTPAPVAVPAGGDDLASRLARAEAERDGLAALVAELRGRVSAVEAERDRALADRDRDVTAARSHLAAELARLAGEVVAVRRERDAERVERQAVAAAHVVATAALAGLSGELDRYGRLGALGRLLQPPPSPRALPGPGPSDDLDGDR